MSCGRAVLWLANSDRDPVGPFRLQGWIQRLLHVAPTGASAGRSVVCGHQERNERPNCMVRGRSQTARMRASFVLASLVRSAPGIVRAKGWGAGRNDNQGQYV